METMISPPALKPNFTGLLPDERLSRRCSGLLSDISASCSAVVARISRDHATQSAYYRFLNNDRVESSDLVRGLANFAKEKSKKRHVLVIQDTTELNYRHHWDWMDPYAIGPAGNNEDPGFFLHPSLVVDALKRCPIGFSDVHAWMRDFDRKEPASGGRADAPPVEKESSKWLKSAERTKAVLSEAAQLTIIADREADIFQLFAKVPDHRTDLIVRAKHNRALFGEEGKLFDLPGKLAPAGSYRFRVRGENRRKDKKRTQHEALMEVRFGKAQVARPKNLTAENPKFLEMYIVEVIEHPSTVPPGEEPVHWLLLTTHRVEDFATARRIVDWYRQRWHIEQVFRILKKKGMQLENSRLTKGKSLIKLAIMSLQASVKILQVSLARNADPKIPANTVFSDSQIGYLWVIKEKYEGKTQRLKNPYPPESLAWAAWTIARLGGWKGYFSQGRPGPNTFKRGIEKFENMIETFEIFGLE